MNLKSAHTAKIGKAFIKARILRSLTQEEIANLTLINIDYIKAIESGDYQNFPARMFAVQYLSLIHISEPTRLLSIAVAGVGV